MFKGDCYSNDGVCNHLINNIAECKYDGGDCCSNPNPVGDGVCNDETNNLTNAIAECEYDDGDCCPNDGSCNEETINPECTYDGGDGCFNYENDYCDDNNEIFKCNCDGED